VTTTLEEMVQLGLHLGHQARKWNPKMAPYIYGKRNGTHIIDIVQTVSQLKEVSKFLTKAAGEGKTFLFVGTKKQISQIVKEAALDCNSYYLTQRWLGGMLTNWQTMKTSLARLTELKVLEKYGQFDAMPKKQAALLRKQMERLEAYLGGVESMKKIPDVVIIIGQPDERNAVLECKKLGIPTVTLLDTDCDPTLADLFVPANDDSPGAVKFLLHAFADAICEGQQKVQEKKSMK
jgi:small subunit ribosomal protein S2